MITANEVREMMKVRKEEQNKKAKQAAIEWCEGVVATCVKSAVEHDEEPRITLCACDLDGEGCRQAAKYLVGNGFKVRVCGVQFFTIEW